MFSTFESSPEKAAVCSLSDELMISVVLGDWSLAEELMVDSSESETCPVSDELKANSAPSCCFSSDFLIGFHLVRRNFLWTDLLPAERHLKSVKAPVSTASLYNGTNFLFSKLFNHYQTISSARTKPFTKIKSADTSKTSKFLIVAVSWPILPAILFPL